MEGSNLPLKKAHIEKRDSPFASAAGRTRSYQEEAAVAPELRSQLESIGMRTRFNVSRGYGSPPPSEYSLAGGHFATDNQILQTVKNTRSSWNRTKSAPLYSNELTPFCGTRAELDSMQDENEPQSIENHNEMNMDDSTMQGIGLDLKRTRDEVFGDWADEGDEKVPSMDVDATAKAIAAMPKRNSPTSKHTLSRATAQTLPALSSYLSSAQDIIPDLSAFTNRTDF